MTPLKLYKLMESQDWDECDLADLTGHNRSTINRYVNGKRKIPDIFSRYLKLVVAIGTEKAYSTFNEK